MFLCPVNTSCRNLSDSSEILSAWFEQLSGASLATPASEIAGASTAAAISDPVRVRALDVLLLTISRPAMACEWEVLLNQHQYPQGAEAAMHALDLVEQLEGLHSVFRPHSDLIAINRFAAARPVAVSQDTYRLLQLARDMHAMTAGAFDMTAGSLSQIWGFSRRAGRMPNEHEIAAALDLVGNSLVVLDDAPRHVSLAKPGVLLNPGGIGKGYALDRAGRKLLSAGLQNFMMHGGLSSVVAQGDRQHRDTGGGWLVALKHPWRWEEKLGTIRLRNQALGTSGSGKTVLPLSGATLQSHHRSTNGLASARDDEYDGHLSQCGGGRRVSHCDVCHGLGKFARVLPATSSHWCCSCLL